MNSVSEILHNPNLSDLCSTMRWNYHENIYEHLWGYTSPLNWFWWQILLPLTCTSVHIWCVTIIMQSHKRFASLPRPSFHGLGYGFSGKEIFSVLKYLPNLKRVFPYLTLSGVPWYKLKTDGWIFFVSQNHLAGRWKICIERLCKMDVHVDVLSNLCKDIVTKL